MYARLAAASLGRLGFVRRERAAAIADPSAWAAQPPSAQRFVITVVVVGASALAGFFPLTYPNPALFILLLVFACVTSAWKVTLPRHGANGSTLSVSYAADLMALLLLGPHYALVIAVGGALTQCTYNVKQPSPFYRTAFSVAAEAITMVATGIVYVWLDGPLAPVGFQGLAKPLVGAIATYFLINTTLVAAAIAFSTGRPLLRVWRDDFLWIGASFMVAGTAGAIAAVIVQRGEQWKALLMIAPIYLTYRTYDLFAGRLEDQKQHVAQMQKLHQDTVEALSQARAAERALAEEKERLARTVADLERLEKARVQLLEREQAARASAEAANRLKDQFLATVSHELRTPLNSILGWSDMLRRGVVDETRRGRACEVIFQSARRQAQLVDDLLDVARIMSETLRLERTVVELGRVVGDAINAVQPLADAKQIRIALHVDARAALVDGDSARLQQVAGNLLANAIKFTPCGGAVYVRVRRTDRFAEMIVADTGQGIRSDFLPEMFEPFRQADGSTTRVHGGLGLGLAIVRHLVDAHGGTVRAESSGEGRGATFVVCLPALDNPPPPDPPDRTAVSPTEVEDTRSLDGVSVLVVDDDDETRDVVKAHLEDHHAIVLTAASAPEALDTLARARVDVLLADIAMPGEDGYSLIRKVRASHLPQTASIPAAAFTALAREEDRRRALDAGFQLHLAKPLDAGALVGAVVDLASARGTPACAARL